MINWTKTILWSGLLLLAAACTPKTTEPISEPATTEPAPQQPAPVVNTGPCRTFDDAPNKDEALRNYVLYRDFMKVEDWDQAYAYWQRVYKVAPAADGKRNTILADGIQFFERFRRQETDSLKREAYITRIFGLYDQIDECYPEGGFISARKAFDLYYNYPYRVTRKEIYDLFKAAIDQDGLKAPDFVLNPFSALLVELYFNDEISMAEAQEYQQKVRDILAEGLANCEGAECDRWQIIQEYAPSRLEAFETVRGFYDCDYYLDKYYQDYLDDPENCDVIRTVFSRLRFGGCTDSEEKFRELIRVGNELCAPAGTRILRDAYTCLQNAEYECAVENFTAAAEQAEDAEKKADYLLIVAKIYNAHLRDFPKAREIALQAAQVRPNWGEPYILIGRLYASSGPLCGPGRGWDSQIVVWPAIDMWNKAKQVDPSSAAEANKWIRQYAQYMPNREEVFIRNLQAGDSFYVGCWIQRATVIRTAD